MVGKAMLERETSIFPLSFKSLYVSRAGLAMQTMQSKTFVGIQEHISKYMRTHPLQGFTVQLHKATAYYRVDPIGRSCLFPRIGLHLALKTEGLHSKDFQVP